MRPARCPTTTTTTTTEGGQNSSSLLSKFCVLTTVLYIARENPRRNRRHPSFRLATPCAKKFITYVCESVYLSVPMRRNVSLCLVLRRPPNLWNSAWCTGASPCSRTSSATRCRRQAATRRAMLRRQRRCSPSPAPSSSSSLCSNHVPSRMSTCLCTLCTLCHPESDSDVRGAALAYIADHVGRGQNYNPAYVQRLQNPEFARKMVVTGSERLVGSAWVRPPGESATRSRAIWGSFLFSILAHLLAHARARFPKARAHCRPHGIGHQLHYDSDGQRAQWSNARPLHRIASVTPSLII